MQVFELSEVLAMGKVRMTFSIPDELKAKLDRHPDINWPEVFKQGILKKLEALERLRARGEI